MILRHTRTGQSFHPCSLCNYQPLATTQTRTHGFVCDRLTDCDSNASTPATHIVPVRNRFLIGNNPHESRQHHHGYSCDACFPRAMQAYYLDVLEQ